MREPYLMQNDGQLKSTDFILKLDVYPEIQLIQRYVTLMDEQLGEHITREAYKIIFEVCLGFLTFWDWDSSLFINEVNRELGSTGVVVTKVNSCLFSNLSKRFENFNRSFTLIYRWCSEKNYQLLMF